MAARKGVRELLEAFRLMYGRRKDLTLILVGWGPLENEVRKKISRWGLDDNVILVKSPPHDEMKAIVATADIAMFHSYWEGYGLTFGEALASETPCVLTDVGGASEMVVEGTGKLVEVGDIKGQADAALDLLSVDNPEDWGKRGREHIKRYCSWDGIAEKTEKFYKWVVEDPENKEGWREDFERCP